MDDAVETVSEIIATCIGAFDDVEDVETRILAAIQADPLAYVKPKPLVWVVFAPLRQEHYEAFTELGEYHVGPRASDGRFEWNGLGHDWGDESYPTLEAAQAAAYDDLCKRVKELF